MRAYAHVRHSEGQASLLQNETARVCGCQSARMKRSCWMNAELVNIYPCGQALTEFKKLLLATPLGQDPELKEIRRLVLKFREWTKSVLPSKSSL